ncbi:SAFB-like transcription modulator isoform X2 [Drosophila grimshawi]|uniref:SAFB-like transcription modulator isoform X2 n=1 Tax=Drosophila grimshawi TaxID=7222 RepID=UPI000C86EF4A|nr:SAFB-like transcription modulator isoform X2 [Drosophila grimshawi]
MPEIGKKVGELRVSDLKEELEKRKLETVGPKSVLIERLERALKEEGVDPSIHLIESSAKAKKPIPVPMKEPESSEVLIKEEPIDPDEANQDSKEEAEDGAHHADGDGHEIDQVGDVDDVCVILDDDDDDEEEEESAAQNSEQRNGEVEASEGADAAEGGEAELAAEDEMQEENTGDTVNMDNDESINLTIGEDEQKLLHDEAPDDKSIKSVKPAIKTEKSSAVSKDGDKKTHKEDDNTRSKKKDDKSTDKKDSSDQKASKSSNQKDDKEKTSSTAAAATGAASSASSGAAANKLGSGGGSGSGSTGASSSNAAGKQALLSRNLWVSGLSTLTRASDLKAIFSKFGKVIGAKVVTNTRTPGTRCYGYVTMSSSGDASRCIENLHRTELHGRIISVERTKNEIGGSASSSKDSGSKANSKTSSKSSNDSKKKEDDKKSGAKDDKKAGDADAEGKNCSSGELGNKRDGKDKERNNKSARDDKEKASTVGGGDKRHERDHRSGGHKSQQREVSNDRRPAPPRLPRDVDREIQQRQRERERRQREMLSYQKIREERERQRLRERERELREEERRRREARERQRVEEERLAEERRKLVIERERLEREKAELLRMERERQKLEREKIELERLELKRQQMKIMESRDDPVKRSLSKRTDDRYSDVTERKRSNVFDVPPPPRFDASLVSSRTSSYDKKHDDYVTSSGSKRVLEDYSSSKYSNKRGEYGSTAGTKRSAIEDYAAVPSKRSGGNEYATSSKHDYTSTTTSKRDDYKREVEVRHLPVSSSGVGAGGSTSSYVHKSNAGGGVGSYVHKNNTGNVAGSYGHKNNTSGGAAGGGGRYNDTDRSNTSNYRRGAVDDTHSMSHGNKRYDTSTNSGAAGGYGSNSNVNIWAPSGGGSASAHLGGGGGQLKSSYSNNGMSSNMHGNNSWQKSATIEDNSWRPMQGQSQSRFDRNYNERSGGGYQGNSGAGGMYGGSRPAQDRYGGQVTRY